MRVSLNEVQYMTRRACVGAGLPHGLADDAAWAIRWLCDFGLPGLDLLLPLVERYDAAPSRPSLPVLDGALWRWAGAADAPLSPLVTGPSLAEIPVLAGSSTVASIECRCVLYPSAMLPWIGLLARRSGRVATVTLRSPDALSRNAPPCYALSPESALRGPRPTPAAELGDIRIDFGTGGEAIGPPLRRGAALADGVPASDALWARLGEFAFRGYVAATDESRRLGAGAGLVDQD